MAIRLHDTALKIKSLKHHIIFGSLFVGFIFFAGNTNGSIVSVPIYQQVTGLGNQTAKAISNPKTIEQSTHISYFPIEYNSNAEFHIQIFYYIFIHCCPVKK